MRSRAVNSQPASSGTACLTIFDELTRCFERRFRRWIAQRTLGLVGRRRKHRSRGNDTVKLLAPARAAIGGVKDDAHMPNGPTLRRRRETYRRQRHARGRWRLAP